MKTAWFIIVIGWVIVAVVSVAALAMGISSIRSRNFESYKDPPAPEYWPTLGWRNSFPEEQGIDSDKLAEGLQNIRQKDIHIHSLLIIRNGRIVVKAAFYPYDGKTPHNTASVTKSLTTTLIGIAVEQGKLRLDQPMLAFFPEKTSANPDRLKEKVTIRDLASMSAGLDCAGLESGEATVREMEASPDWVQFILDRKMAYPPGAHFVYCGLGMHMLSAILQQATGMSAQEFARQYLFTPLGIQQVYWPTDPQGVNLGAGNARLLPEDMAKIGYLWLHKGVWDGQQIVPRQWVESSVRTQIRTGMDDDYGYGWWVVKGESIREYAADGMGGQRIGVFPDLNLILVTTGGGFTIDEVVPFLVPALVDMENPLPANPDGAARLSDVIEGLLQEPTPKPVSALPEMAAMISGRTYRLDPNIVEMKSLRLDFDDPAEAHIQFTFDDGTQSPLAAVGLDGVYRLTPGVGMDRSLRKYYGVEALPVALRGSWTDPQTFTIEYDTISNRYAYVLHLRFDGKHVMAEITERGGQAGEQVEGVQESQ